MAKHHSTIILCTLVLFVTGCDLVATGYASDLGDTPNTGITPTSTATQAAGPDCFATITPTPDRWQLVWSDEFDQPDGSVPDPARWNYAIGGTGWGNAELQYYTDDPDHAYIENGMLVIKAEKKRYMENEYVSASLNTTAKGEWIYGRFEVRAKLPVTQGIWPAFWMLPATNNYGEWPASGEMDIMEFIGREPGRVYGTIHFGNPYETKQGYYELSDGKTFADDFHVFTMEWEPNQFRWFVDGNLYYTTTKWFTSAAGTAYPAPFDQPFYLIVNLAVGGNWPGYPDSSSTFPQYLYVDYVRIYQQQP